jgi:hypothetical protein
MTGEVNLLSERTKRSIVQAMLLPLRIMAAVYWYGGGRFVHTSRDQEAMLRETRRTATRNSRSKPAGEDEEGGWRGAPTRVPAR